MSATFKNLLLLITALLALVGGYWIAQLMHKEAPITTPTYGGGEMIDFTLPDLEGNNRSLSEWRGKVILLNFWATWCPPCREEIPLFISLQKKHQADNLQVIGVAIDSLKAVKVFHQSARINYQILIGEDLSMPLVAQYGNRMESLPYTVIIDRTGSIAVRKLGAFSPTELENMVEPLLKAQ